MGPIAEDLGIAAGQGQRTSTMLPGGAVNALNCGDGRVVAGAITTMSKRMLASAPTAAATATMAVVCRPLPNRQRIAGPSRESRRKSSDDSAEGQDRGWRRDDNRRTRQRRGCRQSTGCEGNTLPTTNTATGSGESGQGRMTKATNESGRTITVSD